MRKTEMVKVEFNQNGIWGGVTFEGELTMKPNIWEVMIPTITITNGPEQFLGYEVTPDKALPGLFGTGYGSPFSGKCYAGYIEIGDDAKSLKKMPPPVIYSSKIDYLHVIDGKNLTDSQKALLLEAVRFDKPRSERFSAGESICELFTKDELEGTMKDKIFYA